MCVCMCVCVCVCVFYVTNTFFLKKIPISLTIIHFSWLSFFAGILIFHCMARKLKWFALLL